MDVSKKLKLLNVADYSARLTVSTVGWLQRAGCWSFVVGGVVGFFFLLGAYCYGFSLDLGHAIFKYTLYMSGGLVLGSAALAVVFILLMLVLCGLLWVWLVAYERFKQ